MKRILAALAARMPAVDCRPHPDLDDTPDAARLPADTTRNDYRRSATNG